MQLPIYLLSLLMVLPSVAYLSTHSSLRTRVTFVPKYNTKRQQMPFIGRVAGLKKMFSPSLVLLMISSDDLELKRVPSSIENVPIPFIDPATNSFIECYADSVVAIEGETYTIAVPCDYSVALCYFDDDDQLIPIELNDPLMDDIFPMAESIVAEEFGEDLVLQRTPQTLTLVGELEDEDDEEEEDEGDEEGDEEDEEVEVLLSFEHRDQEINLVRLLDPILLVGKNNPDDTVDSEEEGGTRLLLTPEESDKVMPLLEDLFLKFHDDDSDDSKLP